MYSNGNFKDNRYRPGLESSARRVREDEFDRDTPKPVWSNELSFVPQRRRKYEPHDAQTKALIRTHQQLEQLRHGPRLIAMLDEWNWIDRMRPLKEKQEHLEKMILAARRDPAANEHILTFLLIALEPARQAVSKQFMDLRSGLEGTPRDADHGWLHRGETQLVERLDREQLLDVTRYAVIEAIYRYPPDCKALFAWFTNTIAHRALDGLRAELAAYERRGLKAIEAEALQTALHGLDSTFAPPATNDLKDFAGWRRGIDVRVLYETVGEFRVQHSGIRAACDRAIRRLPQIQQETIRALFFDGISADKLAESRGRSRSTIDNNNAKAKANLRGDEVFFIALHGLGVVRDRVRADELNRRYPDGTLPDGRRLYHARRAA